MPKPNEFYVGVLDFFAILLPGGIAVAILEQYLGPYLIGNLVAEPASTASGWALFLVSAYFVGHIVFQIGSYIDHVYDKVRKKLSPYDNESAYQCATRIKEALIDQTESKALNTFQWARAVLILKHPAGAADVARLEADSKFFRSLLVVSLFAFLLFAIQAQVMGALLGLGISALCFNRYYDRRLKSTTQAYIHMIAMCRLGALNPADAEALPNKSLETDA